MVIFKRSMVSRFRFSVKTAFAHAQKRVSGRNRWRVEHPRTCLPPQPRRAGARVFLCNLINSEDCFLYISYALNFIKIKKTGKYSITEIHNNIFYVRYDICIYKRIFVVFTMDDDEAVQVNNKFPPTSHNEYERCIRCVALLSH